MHGVSVADSGVWALGRTSGNRDLFVANIKYDTVYTQYKIETDLNSATRSGKIAHSVDSLYICAEDGNKIIFFEYLPNASPVPHLIDNKYEITGDFKCLGVGVIVSIGWTLFLIKDNSKTIDNLSLVMYTGSGVSTYVFTTPYPVTSNFVMTTNDDAHWSNR